MLDYVDHCGLVRNKVPTRHHVCLEVWEAGSNLDTLDAMQSDFPELFPQRVGLAQCEILYLEKDFIGLGDAQLHGNS